MGKTVYILGAGFSKSVGAPLQSEIMEGIFSLTDDNILSLEPDIPIKARYILKRFKEFKSNFQRFLKDDLCISETNFKDVSLEDIYSLIDKSIISNLSFRNISKNKLIRLRSNINALIIILMKFRLKEIPNFAHIEKFTDYLINLRRSDYDGDPFTIISTNWDIIIENSIMSKIQKTEGILDYCFYLHEYRTGNKLRSGMYARGQNKYNLKVIKLHGSMNWLQCQRCQRVYVTYFEKNSYDEIIERPTCPHCERYFALANNNNNGAYLSSVLIMPTFLKDLNIFQLKLSWQIAGIELQEADKIVFMGYSFPSADFDFRHLLGGSVTSDSKIEVVLWKTDDPKNYSNELAIQKLLPEFRYRSFFGEREIKFFYKGVSKYIMENFNSERLSD